MASADHNQVIVVGGGLAGMSAAHTILEHGGRVLLLDKSAFCGGNSTKATSGINGAGTRTQRANGNPDTPETFYEDTKKSAGGTVRPNLIKALSYESGPAVEWLTDSFDLGLDTLGRLGGHSQHRTHRFGKGGRFPGMEITYTLIEALEKVEADTRGAKARIENKATVTKLIKDASGAVVGCEYEKEGEGMKKAFGPVIIATGGFGADFSEDSLLAEVEETWRSLPAFSDVPTRLVPGLRTLPTTNGKHCTGDGIKLARDAGAGVCDMHMVQVHPTGLVQPSDPTSKTRWLAAGALRGAGAIILDREGHRFVDELGHRDHVTGRMWKHDKAPYRLVLNGSAIKKIEWHCLHYEGRGLMKKYTGLEGLAKDMGGNVTARGLAGEFADYNKCAQDAKAKKGTDRFGKEHYNFFSMPWKADDTFYVAQIGPTVHYTMGGISSNEFAECLDGPDGTGRPVPGLFCGGEVLGGIHGENRLGGSSLLDCVVFGRIAGKSSARYQLSQKVNQQAYAPAAARRVDTLVGQFPTLNIAPQANGSINISFIGGASDAAAAAAPAPSAPAAAQASAAKAPAAAAPAPAAAGPKTFSLAEIKKHNSADDCWVVLENKVYNVTDFLDDHPGGKGAIMLYAGKDATKEFLMLHKPSVITKYGAKYLLGEVDAAGAAVARAAVSASAPLTMDEVAKHKEANDCWVVIKGKVYDVTKFLPDHPGGKGAILMYAGKDATEEFEMLHKPEIIDRYAKKFELGDVKK